MTPNYDMPSSGHAEQPTGHEYFEWLCALSTSGSLTEREKSVLRDHLEECLDCRDAKAEFQFIAVQGMPLLAGKGMEVGLPIEERHAWAQENAKQSVLERVWDESGSDPLAANPHPSSSPGAEFPIFGAIAWQRTTQLFGVALCLFAAVGIGGYRIGLTRVRSVQSPRLLATPTAMSHEAEAHAAVDNLQRELKQKEATTRELKQKLTNVESLQAAKSRELDEALAQNASLRNVRDTLVRVVSNQNAAVSVLRGDLDTLQTKDQDHLLHISDLKARLEAQSKSSSKHQETVVSEPTPHSSEPSVSDTDLRELMGARKLYLTDVVDVDNNGHTRQPFGRIFYTAGKSLIFYAFDLDQQPGLRNTSFQLWGQRGSNPNDYVNMGVFNLDSETNRRWVLKFDDPSKLAQINAVFVTVEPIGGSHKPAGKQLLYASIRTLPNHP
jgi:hypothetical protein